MLPKLVEIIVIGFGPKLKDIEKNCIGSIIENTNHPYILTYIDNFENEHGSLTNVWNDLISVSSCEYILLNNNDTEVTEGWLSEMIAVLLSDEKIAFVGPSTNQCHSIQKTIPTEEQAKKQKKGEFVEVPQPLSGFCLLLRRSVWEELGGFDERYLHYGAESDFCDRAHKKGYKSAWVKSAFVYHVGGASFRAAKLNIDEERTKAKKLYWGERRK